MDIATPRQRARIQTIADITRIGREHLATQGAAALSLRAVARDLGVVSSAVYRYVKSRDELLTLLVIDAYNELGDAVDAAIDRAGDNPEACFLAAGRAIRAWALDQPARYGLIYGTPVPGYAAPAEQTTAPGTRVIFALVRVLERGTGGGTMSTEALVPLPRVLRSDLKRIRETSPITLPDGALARALLAWVTIFGAVSFEVFGGYGAETFADPAALFDVQLRQIVVLLEA